MVKWRCWKSGKILGGPEYAWGLLWLFNGYGMNMEAYGLYTLTLPQIIITVHSISSGPFQNSPPQSRLSSQLTIINIPPNGRFLWMSFSFNLPKLWYQKWCLREANKVTSWIIHLRFSLKKAAPHSHKVLRPRQWSVDEWNHHLLIAPLAHYC